MTSTSESQTETGSSDRLDDYLLHEFDHQAASLLQNEDAGERRVQVFLTIWAAIFAVIAFAIDRENTGFLQALQQTRPAILTCLFALLLLGASAFLRLVHRNITTDRHKFALRALRRQFVDKATARANPNAFFKPYDKEKRRSAKPIKGGWLDVVMLLNSASVAMVVLTLLHRSVDPVSGLTIAVGILTFAGALVAQICLARRRYCSEWKELDAADSLSLTGGDR